MRGCARLATFVLASALAWSARAQGGAAPGLQCLANGPCLQPDSKDLLRSGGRDFAMASNFGLLVPAAEGTGYEYVCEEMYGGRLTDTAKVGPDGRVYVPAYNGIYSSADGCTWTMAGGTVNWQGGVWDIAFDTTGRRQWALVGDVRSLALSTDGGMTFTATQTFPEALRFFRVTVAPSNPGVVYLTGFSRTAALVFAVSTDGGASFTIDQNASAGMAAVSQRVDLLGVAPDDPQTVYFLVTSPDGDQIWKSTSSGKAPAKILTLGEQGEQFGFTFGANGSTVYLGSRDPLEPLGKPPAYLYFTHDAGQTWDRWPSAADGPRYRCLRFADGKLYACAGDRVFGDTFLLGSSSDEGKTWSPVVRLSDLHGVRRCVAERCVLTTNWLCESYGVCAGARDGGIPGPPDAGAGPGTGGATGAGGRKGCALGGGGAPGGGTVVLAMILIGALLIRRRRAREGV
jgi:photosystem II stability/assembly factor-like uncharacterized protein